MIEYELSIFLLITSTVIMVQIGFKDFFLNKLNISTENYARFLFYLVALQLAVIIGATIITAMNDYR